MHFLVHFYEVGVLLSRSLEAGILWCKPRQSTASTDRYLFEKEIEIVSPYLQQVWAVQVLSMITYFQDRIDSSILNAWAPPGDT